MTTAVVTSALMRVWHAIREFLKGVFSDHSKGPGCC